MLTLEPLQNGDGSIVAGGWQQDNQRLHHELLLGVASFVGVTVVGTVGYRLIEGWRWLDSAYMTIITLATVGFSEVHPVSDEGRVFTISLILMGAVSIAYIANRFTEALIRGYFQDRLRQRTVNRLIGSLSEHYIICGFGRTGQQVALEFAAEHIEFVVIDANPEVLAERAAAGYITLQADATLDESLLQAGVMKATCLVAAMPSDAENLYTILSAKTLNPNIRAIARANTAEAVQKLQRGGADAVISPYITGGKRMAAAALRPQVMDFVDGILTGSERSFYLEEFLLEREHCPSIGLSLRQAQVRSRSGALVLAIKRADQTLIPGPTADTVLQAGDLLICMGTEEQLRRLNQLLGPIKRQAPRKPRLSFGDRDPEV
jgi:voltage-gated potassium channel